VTLSLGPQRETVPDVVGMTFDVASEKIQAANLTVVRGDDKFDDNLPAGSVLSVDPAVNTVVKPGAKVTVTVSKGKAPISVPSVIGLNINDAIAKLQQLGLQVDQEQVDSPDKPAGQVINQDPAAGSGVEKDTHVKLQISKGPPLVTVPPVVGMKCQDAKAQLEGQGFKVTIQGFDQSTVRFQNPAENSQVPGGTEITLGCIF
jgi:serine/threonine-protein kinase